MKSYKIDFTIKQLCCPKCKGTTFTKHLQNIPIPSLTKGVQFLTMDYEKCVTCGWQTIETIPEIKNKRDFNKALELSRQQMLKGLRLATYGYKPTFEEKENSFIIVDIEK